MKYSQLVLCFSLCLALLSSCVHQPTDTRPRITVSIEPLRYFVEQIAGDKYNVISLTPQGASPETYEPTPQQMVDLSQSQIYFAIGTLGYEKTQLKKIADTAPSIKIATLDEGISLLPTKGHHDLTHSGDPHIWMSTQNAKIIARHICKVLCQNDTIDTLFYQKNLVKFEHKIDALDKDIRGILKNVVHRTFLIYHPALGYYAKDYGLKQICIEQDGKEPGAQYMQTLIQMSKNEHIQTVFVEKEYNGQMAKVLARDIPAKLFIINPLGYNWPKEMKSIAENIVQYDTH